MNYQEKAEKFLQFFEQIKRGEDTITILKPNAPKELYDSVMNAHGDRLPNDWIFDKYESILSNIGEYEDRELDDIRGEIVDGLVDCYTSDLTSWLNESPYNVYYIDEAREQYGESESGFNMLSMAQYKAIDDIFSEVVALLEKEDE
jgi:hypothetical protein